MYPTMVLLHVLGATVWTGGHLVLAVGILPGALRQGSVLPVQEFEAVYERLGIPALVLQVVTGVWLAWQLVPDPIRWVDAESAVSRTLMLKLILLALTVALAVHARLRIIPGLTRQRLPLLAVHIVMVTLLAVGFVIVGVLHRFGGVL